MPKPSSAAKTATEIDADAGIVFTANRLVLLRAERKAQTPLPPPPPPPQVVRKPPPLPFANKGRPAPPLPVTAAPALVVVDEVAVDELHKFLAWKDAKVAGHAQQLLEMYPVQQIAAAVRERYGMTPPGWRTVHLAITASKNDSGIASSLPPPTSASKMNLVINELLDTEMRFIQVLQATEREYVDKLFEVYGSGNAKQIKALGLSQQEANLVFEKLVHIRQFSEELMQRLYCVDLVRDTASDARSSTNNHDRVLCVANAFRSIAPRLHVFAPASMCYKDSLDILATASRRLSTSSTSSSSSSSSSSATATFVSLWEEATSKDGGVLQGQQFGAVLIQPMQRIPRYKMLLEALLKGIESEDGHDDAAVAAVRAAVQEALDMVSSAAEQINAAVGKHEKLGKMFGATMSEAISTSSGISGYNRGSGISGYNRGSGNNNRSSSGTWRRLSGSLRQSKDLTPTPTARLVLNTHNSKIAGMI